MVFVFIVVFVLTIDLVSAVINKKNLRHVAHLRKLN